MVSIGQRQQVRPRVGAVNIPAEALMRKRVASLTPFIKGRFYLSRRNTMAITKAHKKELYEGLSSFIGDKGSMVFVNFHKLKVADATAMRRKLKTEGVKYLVAKKSVTKKVLEAKKITGEMPVLEGEVGLAYGDDLVAPAREVYAFQKKLKDSVAILGGVFEGRFMSKDEMVAIAAIPGTDTLRGMFVNIINSPIQRMAIALSEIAKKKTA
jgi:large subunit ribosomal protein L10